MNEDSEFYTPLSAETITVETTGLLNAWNCNRPFVSFTFPPELSQYFTGLEYVIPVPPTFQWAFYSCGEFAVSLTVTLSANSMEVISLDSVKVDPSLPGGF